MTYVPRQADQEFPPRSRPIARSAARVFALALAALPLSAGLGMTAAHAATGAASAPAAGGCRGITPKAIPAQGVITNVPGTQGGHFWWASTDNGTCVGTVVEDVQVTAAAPTLTLRVIVFDTANAGGLTVARQQITAGPGPVSLALGVHQAFAGLREVCLAATSPVVASPDLPCAVFGRLAPMQQFTQPDTGMQPFIWP